MRLGRVLHLALVVWACVSGYQVRGQDNIPSLCRSRPCLNGGTCTTDGTCSCIDGYSGDRCQTAVNCGDPGAPDHGYRTNSTFTYNTTVSFSCQRGYKLSYSSPWICTASGSWNRGDGNQELPTCTTVPYCGMPDTPSRGSVIGSSFSYGDLVTFTCKSGYRLSFTNAILCGADGQWNQSIPACVEGCTSSEGCTDAKVSNCCVVNGQPTICCRSGVQKILDDRYGSIKNDACKRALQTRLGVCAKDYIGCLNNLVSPPPSYKTCPSSHGCIPTASGCTAGTRCWTSIAMDNGRWSNTSFCLPTECAGQSRAVLDSVARSDGNQHCSTLEQLSGLHDCPLNYVLIHCDDGTNGEFFPGYNPTPPPGKDDNGKKTGNIIGIILGVLAVIVLVVVAIFFYRRNKASDSVDFGRLEEDSSPLQAQESAPPSLQPTGEEDGDV